MTETNPSDVPTAERRQLIDLIRSRRHELDESWQIADAILEAGYRLAGPGPDTGQARADHLAAGIRRFADDCKLLLDFGGLDNRVARSIAQQERNLRALLAEPSGGTAQASESPTDSTPKAGRWGSSEAETATDTVQTPDVAALVADGPLGLSGLADALDNMVTEHKQGEEMDEGWMQDIATQLRAHRRALLGTDTTPDRLAWIDTAAGTAAAERQARYQETACARRPAEEHPDA